MELLVALPLLAVAVAGAVVVAGAIRATRMPLRRMRVAPVELTRVPAASRAVLAAARPWLLARGFRHVGSWGTRPLPGGRTAALVYSDVYLNAASGVFAVADAREPLRPETVPSLVFQSVLPDGTVVGTGEHFARGLGWVPPGWRIHDEREPDPAVALGKHLLRVEQSGVEPVRDVAMHGRVVRRAAESCLDALVAAGRARRRADGEARLTFGAALGWSWRSLLDFPGAAAARRAARASPLSAIAGTR